MTRLADPQRKAPPTDRRIPPVALALAIASAIPFIAATAAIVVSANPTVRLYGHVALISYGACVLSFLGAVHAGLAMRDAPVSSGRLVVAAIPLVLAWLSLALGERNGLLLMAGSFLAVLAYDIAAARRGWVPAWYPRLRWPLTGLVLVCLMGAMQSGLV